MGDVLLRTLIANCKTFVFRVIRFFGSRTFGIRSQKDNRARLKHANFVRRIAGPVEKCLIPGNETPVIIVNDSPGQTKLPQPSEKSFQLLNWHTKTLIWD